MTEKILLRCGAALVLTLGAQAAPAVCLELSGAQITPERTDYGLLTVEWQAHIENTCEAVVSADLDVHFLDGNGESVYHVRDTATLRPKEAIDVGRRVYVPRRHEDLIEGIEVQTQEHEQPS